VKIAHVVPASNLDLSFAGDFYFCLAHLALQDPEYKRFFIDRVKEGREVYLDNGVWETGTPIEETSMIELAIEMQPAYVYAPDYMNDFQSTVEATISFGDRASNTRGFNSKIIGVMQGNTMQEWIKCALVLSKLPENICHTIAVNTLFLQDAYEYEIEEGARRSKTRLEVLMYIERHIHSFKKQIYCTGFGAPVDAEELPKFTWISGVDTAIACALAAENTVITPNNYKSIKPKSKIDTITLTEEQISFAKYNIRVLNAFTKGRNPFKEVA